MRQAIYVMVLLGLAGAAHATTIVAADLGELSRDARVIVVGRVTSLEEHWAVDRRAIDTLVTLHADTYLKGDFGPTVQFRIPGGRVGRLRSIVIGGPTFAVDERVVVFLGARGPSVPYVLGLSQGVFRVWRDGVGWRVSPPPIAPIAGQATPIVRGDLARRPVPLADFEQRVRALAGGPR